MSLSSIIFVPKGTNSNRKAEGDKVLSVDQLARFLGACRSDSGPYGRDSWAIFSIMGNFGLRVTEATGSVPKRHPGLTGADFQWLGSDQFFVVHTLKKRGRTNEDRVYVSPSERVLLESILGGSPREGRLFPFSPRTVQYWFAHYARLAGLPPRVSPHSLRHTAASMLASANRDDAKAVLYAKVRLRHSLDATERYLVPTPEEQIAAAARKPVIS